MRHSLTIILDTKLKRFDGRFFELKMLEIFTKDFLLKINLKWLIVALSGVMTLQMKKEAPKRYEPPKKQ